MSFDAYVWIDLEFPSEPKDSMTRWKQALLDSGKWSDWGGFGAAAGPVKGFETVAAVLAQAARYAAKQRIEGKQFIFSVALGPTQVKVRAAFDKSQAEWWRALACLARAAAPLDAVGEFGWATAAGNGGRESYLAVIADGNSQFRTMGPDELRRLDRHPAVVELEAKRAELATAAPPVPITLTAPTPRPPGSGRGYRRRGFGGPRPAPVVVAVDVPPDEEALGGDGALDEDAAVAVDLEATTGADTETDADTGDHADDEGGADDYGDEAPAHDKDEPPARGKGRAAAKPAAGKAAAKPAPEKAAAPAKPKAAKPAKPKAAPAKPAPAKKKPAKKK